MLEADIARRYGVSQQAVSKVILKYLRDLPKQQATELRQIEAERLDALWVAVAPAAARGEPRAVDAAVRISERRAKLLGLDMPTRSRLETDDGETSITNFLASADTTDLSLLRQIQDLDPIKKNRQSL